MIFKLLFGSAFLRWMERLGQGYDARRAANESAARGEPIESVTQEPADKLPEYVYPRVQREAMGSLFEVYLAGRDRDMLEGAAREALDEIERLDRQLSHYREDSDLARLNSHAAGQWVRLEPRMYDLIRRCAALSAETGGAFDVTTSPLTRAWGFFRGAGRIPEEEEIAEALASTGMRNVLLEDDDHLVYYAAPDLRMDFGAVGKGYAIDEAAAILRFYHVEAAMLHGGQSTIYALGAPPGEDAWELTIKDPRDHETPIQVVRLRDEALSTSGSYEQFFEVDGQRYSHIIDPRTGWPAGSQRPSDGELEKTAPRMLSVSVVAPNAADSDALSTAFFVMGREATQEFCRGRPNIKAVMMEELPDGSLHITRIGLDSANAAQN